MEAKPLEESEIIARIRAGETQLFSELVQRAQRAAFVTAVSVLRDEGEAEDVVQEAIAKAWAALPGFRQEARFSTWLVQIALNEARMRLRRRKPGQFESIDEVSDGPDRYYVPEELVEWRQIPQLELERSSLRNQLFAAFEQLPWIYREIFLLRDVHNLSIKQAAEVAGITESTVKTRLLRARLRLRDLISGTVPAAEANRLPLAVPAPSPHRGVWMWVSDYLEGDVTPEMRAELEAHLAACPFCRSILEGVRNVIALMRDPRVFPLPEGFERRLREALSRMGAHGTADEPAALPQGLG